MRDHPAVYDDTYTAYQLRRSRFRKWARRFWLNNIAKQVNGPAIDFGCGVGELLRLLPAGSIGFEVNETSVRHCRSFGLDVRKYDPEADRYRLSGIKKGQFQVFIISHVLEHLEKPDDVMGRILASCSRLGIHRIIAVVPGKKGFNVDKTHRTFIDERFFDRFCDLPGPLYHIDNRFFSPVNSRWVGNYFTYNELVVVFNRG